MVESAPGIDENYALHWTLVAVDSYSNSLQNCGGPAARGLERNPIC